MLQSVMKDIANINHEVKVVSRPKQKSKPLWFSHSEDSTFPTQIGETQNQERYFVRLCKEIYPGVRGVFQNIKSINNKS